MYSVNVFLLSSFNLSTFSTVRVEFWAGAGGGGGEFVKLLKIANIEKGIFIFYVCTLFKFVEVT